MLSSGNTRNITMYDICINELTVKHRIEERTKYSATRINLKMNINIEESLKEVHTMKLIHFLTNIFIINEL